MKKAFLTLLTSLTAFSSSAAEIEFGLVSSYDHSNSAVNYCRALPCDNLPTHNTSTRGFMLSTVSGSVRTDFVVESVSDKEVRNSYDRLTVRAGYEVYKNSFVTVTPKIGVSFIDSHSSANGLALAPGVGASLSLTKKISLDFNIWTQIGTSRISEYNGMQTSVALKYKF